MVNGHSYGSVLGDGDGLTQSKVRCGPGQKLYGLLISLHDQIRGWVEDGARSGKLAQCQFYIIQVELILQDK